MERLNDDEELRRCVERSKIAQNKAWDEQKTEFEQRLEERACELKCIGCKKPVEFVPYEGDEPVKLYSQGHFYKGGVLVDTFGYGSCKFDMAKIAVLVCDDCVEEHAITSSWLDKLTKHTFQT